MFGGLINFDYTLKILIYHSWPSYSEGFAPGCNSCYSFESCKFVYGS